MHYFPFYRWIKFFSGCFRHFFFFFFFVFIWGKKKVVTGGVRQVVILYSYNCMGIGLGGLTIGRLRRVVVLWRWSYKQVWLYYCPTNWIDIHWSNQSKEPMLPNAIPRIFFSNGMCQLFCSTGHSYLTYVDRYSGWIVIHVCMYVCMYVCINFQMIINKKY